MASQDGKTNYFYDELQADFGPNANPSGGVVDGVTISGVPTTGQVAVATDATHATWQTPAVSAPGNLTGDTTSVGLATTTVKVNGTTVPAAPAAGSTLTATGTTAAVWQPASIAVDFTNPSFGGAISGFWDTAIAAAIATLGTATTGFGGAITAPPGVYQVQTMIQMFGGQYIVGPGWDYAGVAQTRTSPVKGLTLQAAGTFPNTSPLVKFGTVQYSSGSAAATTVSGLTGGGAIGVNFDGAQLAQSACQTFGTRVVLERCYFLSGVSYALDISGQNTRVHNCVSGNFGAAATLATVFINNVDTKYWNCETRDSAGPTILVNSQHWQIIGGDHYNFTTGATPVIKITSNGAVGVIANCFVDVSNGSGNDLIEIVAANAQTIGPILISGVESYQSAQAVVGITTTGTGAVKNVTVTGCQGDGGFSAIVSGHSGAVSAGLNITNCNYGSTTAIIAGSALVPTVCRGVQYATTKTSECNGVATLSGTGSTTAFTFAHTIGVAPTHFTIEGAQNAVTAAALAPGWSWSASTTQVTVTFVTAPVSGTNNIVFNWNASQF